jgi:hypothetical protein
VSHGCRGRRDKTFGDGAEDAGARLSGAQAGGGPQAGCGLV